jgi:prephenate dehydratase
MSSRSHKIAYQGEPGANSHLACRDAYPKMEPLACPTFEDALAAVKSGEARLAMIPIENSVAGRVADKAIRALKLKPVTEADTAGAARHLRDTQDRTRAVIASALAAEVYGLKVAKPGIEDAQHNTTRFVVLASKPEHAKATDGPVITTFVFRVRNVPAALYKALGGFATNGVNMTKLESYQLEGSFNATMFYADIEGHPDERLVKLAMEELAFFTSEVRLLGTYRASPFRAELQAS